MFTHIDILNFAERVFLKCNNFVTKTIIIDTINICLKIIHNKTILNVQTMNTSLFIKCDFYNFEITIATNG